MAASADYKYDVALSFAGENRDYVDEVARELRARGVRVFYDLYERVRLWGKDLYEHLDDVYRHQAFLVVLFISKAYAERVWTTHERKSAQARALKEKREYVLPARFDKTEIPGIPHTIGYEDISGARPSELVELIVAKLKDVDPSWRPSDKPTDDPVAQDRIPEPRELSITESVSLLKKYVADSQRHIDLHDLVTEEVEGLHDKLQSLFSPQESVTPEEFARRVDRYEVLTERVLHLFATGSYWSASEHNYLWPRSLERIADALTERSGYTVWLEIQRYPAQLLFYAGGISAVARENYELLQQLFEAPLDEMNEEPRAAVDGLHTWAVFRGDVGKMLPGLKERITPASDHLFTTVRSPLAQLIPDDKAYERTFDQFEYLVALDYVCRNEFRWGPLGAFSWRGGHFGPLPKGPSELITKIEAEGAEWKGFSHGLMQGDIEAFRTAKAVMDKLLKESGWRF